jgi:hypothetical protein
MQQLAETKVEGETGVGGENDGVTQQQMLVLLNRFLGAFIH